MNLAERRGLRLFAFCVLYVAQGIPWGFTALFLPVYLASRDVSAAEIGTVVAMTTLPYTFKWAWGPLMDAFTLPRFGRRRPWILLAQGMMAVTIAAMVAIPNVTTDVELLAGMIFVHTVFNSMQDVAVDALAVDLLDENERGRTNGFMYASKYLGGVIGSTGMAEVIDWFGLRAALAMQAGVLLAIMLVPLLTRESAGEPPPRPPLRELVRALLSELRRRSALLCALVMASAMIAASVLVVVTPVLFTQRLGWEDTEYARIAGISLFVALGGSVLGGLLADKVGHRRLAVIASLGLVAVWLGFAATEQWWTSKTFIYATFAFEPLFASVMTMSLFAVCMDTANRKIAATQFAAYMALYSVAATTGYKLAGPITASWDYREIYIVVAVIQLAVTGLIALLSRRR